MHNADRAVLRIGTGIGLAAGICYGLALPMPHLGVIMAWVVLCRPGEALGLKKGLAGGLLLLGIMAAGVLLVPLLTHYALAAVLLDRLLGEVRRFHPLVGFGNLATAVEKRLNNRHLPAGLLAWALVVLPFVALAFALRPLAPFAVDVALLYFALGAQSLCEHAEAIAKPLQDGRLEEARQRVGWIVSRDTSALDESGVAKAGMESVLENGNDAIFGTLFWFALLGGPGALLFRLANTLDAMWGYRTDRKSVV